MIRRQIFLTNKHRIQPINVVFSSAMPIELELVDYTIPSSATIKAYAKSLNSDTVYVTTCTKDGNKITINPPAGFFTVGYNQLQVDISSSGSTIVSFLIDTVCDPDLSTGGTEPVTPEDVKPLVERAEAAATRAEEVAESIPEDYSELSATVASMQADLPNKTVKSRIDFDGSSFTKDGITLNYKQLHDIHLVSPDFAFVVYGDRAYLLSYVQDDLAYMREMRFESVIAATDANLSFVKTSGIYVRSSDGINIAGVDLTDINSENKAYKATVIDNSHKNDVWYPSVKAVTDYVDPTKADVERLSESIVEISEIAEIRRTVDIKPTTYTEGKLYYYNNGQFLLGNSSNGVAGIIDVIGGETLLFSGHARTDNLSPTFIFVNERGEYISQAFATDKTSWTIVSDIPIIVPQNAKKAYTNTRNIATIPWAIIRKENTTTRKVGENNLTEELALKINSASDKSKVFEHVIPTETKPTIVFLFDDPKYDNRAEILEEYGFRGTFDFRIYTFVTTHKPHLMQLIQHGHDIGLYGGSNGEPSSYLSDDWIEWVKQGCTELEQLGYYLPTVYGCHSHKACQKIVDGANAKDIKYVSCVTFYTGDGSTDYTINAVSNNSPYNQILCPYGMTTPKTATEIKADIDRYVSEGVVIPLFTHKVFADSADVVAGTMLESTFREVVEYVKTLSDNGVVDVLTVRGMYNKYHFTDGMDRDYNRTMAGMIGK